MVLKVILSLVYARIQLAFGKKFLSLTTETMQSVVEEYGVSFQHLHIKMLVDA